MELSEEEAETKAMFLMEMFPSMDREIILATVKRHGPETQLDALVEEMLVHSIMAEEDGGQEIPKTNPAYNMMMK